MILKFLIHHIVLNYLRSDKMLLVSVLCRSFMFLFVIILLEVFSQVRIQFDVQIVIVS